jgi:hypothetical protein
MLVVALAAFLAVQPAQAAFHLWSIREIFSNASGTLQYIEFFTADGLQEFVGGQQVVSHNVGNTLQNTFTIGAGLPSGTANHAFLIATASFQSVAGFAPNYVMPNSFLFPAGGTINFFGTPGVVTYTALPTDGVTARFIAGGVNGISSPQNFAGQVVSPVPEPSVWGLAAVGGFAFLVLLRLRRRSA